MSYQIQTGISFIAKKGHERKERKNISYLALPLREMVKGSCIILKEGNKKILNQQKSAINQGIQRAIRTMGLDPTSFKVGVTKDNKLGVWRIE